MPVDKVRFGIIGVGGMGSHHARYLNEIPGAALAAVCDVDPAKLKSISEQHQVPGFASGSQLIASGLANTILICVPHYFHMPLAMEAFARGLHVLCEKPLAVSVKAGREGIRAYEAAAAKNPSLKFGLMFQQRTNPMYQKLRELIVDGELGAITRITWIVTNWFRTNAYYASGGWRATWDGEGGGVLLNQCPHNIDLMQHVVNGLVPHRVTAVGTVGKTHPIEVEDEVSAILEYPNGAIGHFITTTGEAPGTNRLEIAGDRGKIIAEDGKLTFYRTRQPVGHVRQTSKELFAGVENWKCEIPFRAGGDSHRAVTEQFVQVVLKDSPNTALIAPGPEGIRSLEMGNAMLMSALTGKPVNLPVDGDAYDAFIAQMKQIYGGRKSLTTAAAVADMNASFQKA